MKTPDPRYWSPYWQNRTITSFGNLFPNNYDGAILEFWRRHITATLQHVLDIACGNGALTWIANDLTDVPGSTTKITGVDLAAINPFAALGRDPGDSPRVTFVGSVPAENLPFGDGSVDLAISQYGIEYSDLDRSIPEVGRVLNATGRMAFIMHDKESVIIKGAVQHLDDFKRVNDKIRLHDYCLEYDQLLRTDRNLKRLVQTPAYSALELRLSETFYHVRSIARAHPASSPLARYLQSLGAAVELKSGKDSDRRRKLIIEAGNQLQAHIERVEDLQHAALSPGERDRLATRVRAQGFSVSEMDVLRYKDGDNFGTTFVARRG